MKKLLEFFKKYWAYMFLFAAWLPITFYNTKIYWMLVDDGYDVVFSRTLFEKLTSLNIAGFFSQLLEAGGRFRPVYWIYHMLVWVIGRNSFQFHHLVHMLVIGLTIYFIYRILHKLTESKTISFFGAITYLLIPINSENILRLGPQEPLVALFLSIFFYLIIEGKRKILPILFLFLAIFTKETSVAILPVVILYYLLSKTIKSSKIKTLSIYSVVSVCVFSLLIILITAINRSGYSTNYRLDSTLIIGNFTRYVKEMSIGTLYILPLMSVSYLSRNLYSYIKSKKFFLKKVDLFETLFLFGFISFFLVQLPWKYVIMRYLMPTMFFVIIFVFLEIYQLGYVIGNFWPIKLYKKQISTLLIGIGFFMFAIWGVQLLDKQISNISHYSMFREMSKLPKNTVVFMNMVEGESTVELVYETQVILDEFWERPDIKVEYLDLQKIPESRYSLVDSDIFYRKYTKEEIDSFYIEPSAQTNIKTRSFILTTPPELVKQTVKKMFKLVFYKDKPTFDGIYTFYYYDVHWYFYNE